MDSHRTGSKTILEISLDSLTLVIKGKIKAPKLSHPEDNSSSLSIKARNMKHILVTVQGIQEYYADVAGLGIFDFKVKPLFFEQTDYVVTVKAHNNETLEFSSNNSLISSKVDRVTADDGSLLSGVINFDNSAGYADLMVSADGINVIAVRIEVYPTKISYKEDYQQMMADINSMVSECVLDFMKSTYHTFILDYDKSSTPAVFFTILQAVYEKYIQACRRILEIPHHKLISEHEVKPFYKVKRIDGRSRKWLEKHPEIVQRNAAGDIRAERILSVEKRITYDTVENRLVKFIIKDTLRCLRDFAVRYSAGGKGRTLDENIIECVKRMENGIRPFLNVSLFKDVAEQSMSKSMSLVFGMAPGYRELYKYYLMLKNGISASGDVFLMSVRDTALVYEYWCFLKLYSILKERYVLKSEDIIKVSRKGVTVDLARGRESRVRFYNRKTGENLFLSYNPSEISTQTVNQRPDNVLELEKKGSSNSFKYVFDAKYKIEMNPDDQYYPDSMPGPRVQDINTMHRYRDAIVYENANSRFTFEKTMFGAYILFPYADEEKYKEHRFYKSIEKVNIGGIPFLPSATSMAEELLVRLIDDSPESAYELTALPSGIEEKLAKINWEHRDVLIGKLEDRNQLSINLNNRFYHIPASMIEEGAFPIRYVAIYQSRKWFGGEAGITWYVEVRKTRAVRRKNITELPYSPDAAETIYYRFDVKEWKQLNKPIAIKEREPNGSRKFTTLFLLEHSEVVPELWINSEDEFRFNSELKRTARDAEINDDGADVSFSFKDKTIAFADGKIFVTKAGKILNAYPANAFAKRPGETFRNIYRDLCADML